jgi:hypothetical protein
VPKEGKAAGIRRDTMPKQDWVWFRFSQLFAKYVSGKITKADFEAAWGESLKKEGITREEFAARYGG